MKDQRVTHFRGTLQALVESLDATARLSRWDDAETAPQPLQESAAKLGEHLGAANRLASCAVVGAPDVVASLGEMSSAIRRLDAAYARYRAQIAARPAEAVDAAVTLDEEIGGVRAEIGL
jgi:hypothetical protein